MRYKRLMDQHVHTDNSFDGHYSALSMCEQAVNIGLRAIAFTDHMDVDLYKEHNLEIRQLHSFFEVSKARSAFSGELLVLEGIELGQGSFDMALAEKIENRFDYDFIIGSLHNLKGHPDFSLIDYSKMTDDEIYDMLETYFKQMYEMTLWGHFDTLAHMTYPLRYIQGEHKRTNITIDRFDDMIDEILKLIIARGKAYEINTSGLRQKINDFMPPEKYVRRFKELGGQFITIGSDAHYVEHLGAGIEEGIAMAERAGFRFVTFFQSREPMPVKIERE